MLEDTKKIEKYPAIQCAMQDDIVKVCGDGIPQPSQLRTMQMEYVITAPLVFDQNGNSASIEKWGSEEAARRSLDTLIDCSACEDCEWCVGCQGCYRCERSYECFECELCSGCEGCSWCEGCSRCSYSLGCKQCEWCVGCSGCEQCSWCSGRKGSSGRAGTPPRIPVIKDIHRAVYAAASAPGALEMDDWHHKCGNRHCRGGWAVALAGDAGIKLELRYGTWLAAMAIYDASGHDINPCRFYDGNDAALVDMKRLAETEHGRGMGSE